MNITLNTDFNKLTEQQQTNIFELLRDIEEKVKNGENLANMGESISITFNADGSMTYESVWEI